MPRLFLASAMALLTLVGCSSLPQPPASVPAVAPPAWQAPLPHGGDAADLARWWQRLGDPALARLVEAAQQASPTLASARSRIEQARAARAGAAAALQPTLDASATAARGNTQLPGVAASTLALGAQAAWELDLFGGKREAARAAQARLAGARAGWHEARVAVAAETANSVLALRACHRQLDVTGRDARSRAETARLTQLSADAGFSPPASAALARASAAEGAARLTQQRAECELEVKTLVVLTALEEPALREAVAVPVPAPVPVPLAARSGGAADSVTASAATPAVALADAALFTISTVPAQLLAQRPDVRRAELEVAAASADVGSAHAQRYPRLSLSGAVALGGVRAAGVSSDAQTWSIGPVALTLPLFDAGRLAANEQAASARYDEAVAVYRGQVRQAVGEVERALVTLASARSRSGDAVTAADGFRASFAATEARYGAGLASLFELEDARRTLLAAETALVGLQRELQTAWVSLYRAAGGGWTRDETGP